MALGLGVGLELAPYLCEVRLEGDLASTSLLDGLLRVRVRVGVRVRGLEHLAPFAWAPVIVRAQPQLVLVARLEPSDLRVVHAALVHRGVGLGLEVRLGLD